MIEGLDAWFPRVVFTVGDARYDWADVVLSAALRGEWAAFEREVRQGLACARQAAENDEEPDPDTVDRTASEFRYARDLISAQDMERWLAERKLTPEDWSAYVERAVLRQECDEAELDDLLARNPGRDDEVATVIRVEGFCSGRFAALAHGLAARVALHARAHGELSEAPAAPTAAELTARQRAVPGRIRKHGLPGVPSEAVKQKLERLAALEAFFDQVCRKALTESAIRAQIATRHLDWIRLDCQTLVFDDEPAAREAALAAREDGLGLDAIGAEAKREPVEERRYLEEVDAELRDRFLAAAPGELVGPARRGEGYALCRVTAKVLPAPDDPDVRARAQIALVTALVGRAVADRVRWEAAL